MPIQGTLTAANCSGVGSFAGQHYPYLIYKPPGYGQDPNKRWPVIFGFQGVGEKISSAFTADTVKGTVNGLLKEVVGTGGWSAPNGRDFQAIIIVIQTTGNFAANYLDPHVQHAKSALLVDPDRVYFTGLSLGAAPCWEYPIAYPGEIAGCLIFATSDDFAATANLAGLIDVPVWAHHGTADTTRFDFVRSRLAKLVNAKNGTTGFGLPDAATMQAMGNVVGARGDNGAWSWSCPDCVGDNRRPRFSSYAGVGHDCWSAQYAGTAVYDWLLAQSRARPANGAPPTTSQLGDAAVAAVAAVTTGLTTASDAFPPVAARLEAASGAHCTISGRLTGLLAAVDALRTDILAAQSAAGDAAGHIAAARVGLATGQLALDEAFGDQDAAVAAMTALRARI